MTELTKSRFNVLKVVEDSPERLVLEDRGSRLFGLLALPLGYGLMHGRDLSEPFDFFGTPLDARWVIGSIVLFALWMILERQRIVFDRAAGTVRRSLRVNRLRNLERPLADMERVNVTSKTETFYGEDSTKYTTHVVFRDGKQLLVNLSGYEDFTKQLRERIESFRP